MGTVASGMAFGAGSAIAHRVVGGVADSMSGDSSEQAAAPAQQQSMSDEYDPCKPKSTSLYQCLQETEGNAQACQFYFEALKQCQTEAQYAN